MAEPNTPKLCAWCKEPFTKKDASTTRRSRYCTRSCATRAVAARTGNMHERMQSAARKIPMHERFWRYVPTDRNSTACWVWTGAVSNGYGDIRFNKNRRFGAHVVSWQIHHGDVPDGMHVLHRCDNPPCVNPDHLFLGTNNDNIVDRVAKGRPGVQAEDLPRGVDNHNAKLNDQQVAEARRNYRLGANVLAMSKEFGVAESTLHAAIIGNTWKHVAEPPVATRDHPGRGTTDLVADCGPRIGPQRGKAKR